MTKHQNADPTSEDIKDRGNNTAQRQAGHAANPMTGGAAIGDPGANTNQQTGDYQSRPALGEVGIHFTIEWHEQDWQNRHPKQEHDTLPFRIKPAAIDKAVAEVRGLAF